LHTKNTATHTTPKSRVAETAEMMISLFFISLSERTGHLTGSHSGAAGFSVRWTG
jgi:hypothetical protein